MSLKFYTDKHIPKAVAIQLRMRGIDVLRCEDVDMDDAKDAQHLEYATLQMRIIITHDDDFAQLDAEWRAAGKKHGGILYCLPHVRNKAGIGRIEMLCSEYHELAEGGAANYEEDFANRIIFVS